MMNDLDLRYCLRFHFYIHDRVEGFSKCSVLSLLQWAWKSHLFAHKDRQEQERVRKAFMAAKEAADKAKKTVEVFWLQNQSSLVAYQILLRTILKWFESKIASICHYLGDLKPLQGVTIVCCAVGAAVFLFVTVGGNYIGGFKGTPRKC